MTRQRAGLIVLCLAWFGVIAMFAGQGARPLWLMAGWITTTGPGLLAAIAVLGSAWAWGRPMRRWMLPTAGAADRIARGIVDCTLGLVLLQSVAVLLGTVGLLTVPAAWIVVGSGLLPLFAGPDDRPPATEDRGRPFSGWWIAAAALLAPALLAIGGPLLAADEGQYHRRFVEFILTHGSFPADAEDAPTGFAQGMHALGTLGAAIGSIGALRPLAFLMGLGGILMGERLAQRLFGRLAGGPYLLIVCGAATALRVVPTFNTDLTLAPFVGVAAWLALDWAREPGKPAGRPWALALVGGGALSIKFTAPLFLAPLYLVVAIPLLLKPVAGRGPALARLAAAAVIPLLFALPWLVKNQITAGHPLWPILGMDAPSALEAAFVFNLTANYGPGGGLEAAARAPWDLFALGREFDRRLYLGRFNAWPLVALPGLFLALRRRPEARTIAIAAALGFVLWAGPLRRAVYLLPLWPLLAALTAGGIVEMMRLIPQPALNPASVAGAILLGAVATAEAAAPWSAHADLAGVACGEQTLEEAAEEAIPDARLLRWLRENTQPDETIAMLWGWHAWDLPNRLLWIGAEDFTPLRLRIHRAGSAEGLKHELVDRDVRWIVHRDVLFLRGAYPMVSDDQFKQAFTQPLHIADEALNRYATRRFAHGPLTVWELDRK
ncbi:MAG: hypothetical protein GY898_22915 [Proteobacteria bacterium]|nr:hypothetical protein [Pseudomonadota bacterium]